MKVLITGGAGFIGSHLADRCLAEGWEVTILDDLSTGRLANIAHLKSQPGFFQEIGSVTNAPLVEELTDRADMVFHLAAAVGVRLVLQDPLQAMETNVRGTAVVLRGAARKRKRIIIASSSEVYGKANSIPFREDVPLVIGPTTSMRWSYACGKALGEFLANAYWQKTRLPVTVVRLFNTVGQRQTGQYGMVLPTFVGQALSGAPLTVFGTGAQTRCFAYVADVVESLVRLATRAGLEGEVINVGSDEEITINQLAALVKQIAGSSSEIVHIPYDAVFGQAFEDMARRVPCLHKLERSIAFRPRTPLETAVRLIVEHERVRAQASASCGS